MKLGFIGLGNIGSGAAGNLVRAGHEVSVADLDATKVQALADIGAIAAADTTAAAGDAQVVFTSLPGPAEIDAVGSELLPAMAAGAVWADLSTNDLATARRLAELAGPEAVALVDAPVSGGPEGAAAGTLSVFVGGADHDVATVRPLLDVIGSRVEHLGPHGAGIVAKIAQVSLCYTQTVTLVEALLLGVKGGVAPERMLEIIQHSAGASYCADAYGPEIIAGTYDASFPLALAARDLRLAMDMAGATGADLPFTTAVAALYAEAETDYGPDAPHCIATQLIERRNSTILHDAQLIERRNSTILHDADRTGEQT